jgi:hypothetical protein
MGTLTSFQKIFQTVVFSPSHRMCIQDDENNKMLYIKVQRIGEETSKIKICITK